MNATFSHHPWSVNEIVAGVDKGTIRLPDIQRPFVWPNTKVRDLIDSMFRGYPVGELMFWASKDPANTRTIGADSKTQEVSMQVVDGQQRLTSLYAVITGRAVWREDYSRESIRLAFNPLTRRFDVPNNATKRSSEWIDDIRSVFADPIRARHDYLYGLRSDAEREVGPETERQVELAIREVALLGDYAFQAVQLKEEVSREVVADIFVRSNSEGVNLGAADFILTWLSVFWEEGRAQLETWARDSRFTPTEVEHVLGENTTWTPKNPYMSFEPGQILRVAIAVGLHRARLQDAYNALRGRDPRTREIHPESREAELALLRGGQAHALNPVHWDEFIRVLQRAGFRSKAMITSENTILYSYALWIVGRVDFGMPFDELREIMARWFCMSQLTGRYTNSPETRMQEDLNRLNELPKEATEFVRVLNGQIDAAVPDDWWRVTLPDNLYTSSAQAPAFVGYVAALNVLDADVLLATSKVKDWISPVHKPVKGIEKHHLFPRDYLKKGLGVREDRWINQVANFALVEWSDNMTISNHPPHEYWPQQVFEKAIDGGRRTRQEWWHALPVDWTRLGYDEFLEQRRRLMADIMHEGFKRLTDPEYDPAPVEIEPVTVPENPRVGLPTFEGLVHAGSLPPRTLLTPVDPERETIAEVTDDGCIRLGEHTCETVDRAAREDRAPAGSGWEYWQAHLDDEDEPVVLADLRERALVAM